MTGLETSRAETRACLDAMAGRGSTLPGLSTEYGGRDAVLAAPAPAA